MSEGIIFQVETDRVLQILTREIYDSPLALLRENLQNAYDAVRMRFARSGKLIDGGRIDIHISNNEISITDNGVGMTEKVLSENFWKAGSSGKHSDDARRAGVVGTFGIGAMANFGVCTRLSVETRSEGNSEVLRSVAEKSSLKIAEKCISLERISSARDVGTTVVAVLDSQNPISVEQAEKYLEPYIRLLPVPVYLNGDLISKGDINLRPPLVGRQFNPLGRISLSNNFCAGIFEVKADSNGQVLVIATEISMVGEPVEGSMVLVQAGGQLMGFRSYFGLAPVPGIGNFQFGGYANLSFLQPTAGREALSRDSIGIVTNLIWLAEQAASELLSQTPGADKNNAFLQWLVAHSRYDLSGKVSIRTFPEDKDIPLEDIRSHIGTRSALYYTGSDNHILKTFANEDAVLLQIAQGNPRRKVQLQYMSKLGIQQVPDAAQVTRVYQGTELNMLEATILLRIAAILRDDYLISNVVPLLADISHRVSVLPVKEGEQLQVHIARTSSLLPPLLEFYEKAYGLFGDFMKDFVRVHIYPKIQEFVPSSTRGGVDALRKQLQRNRELYRYEEADLGELEGVLGDFLAGTMSLTDVLKTPRYRAPAQRQSVSSEQVGSIESEIPGVVDSPVTHVVTEFIEFEPSPPIIRDEVLSDKKILMTAEKHPQLNNFTMLLGLSDRLMQTEAAFFQNPHTTRILWGGHRVIYIFTEATGRLSLYYDIELRGPLERTQASGGMFPTTTLITKNRIFVPVPDALVDTFKITSGPKEFQVRFDVLSSDVI